MEENRIKQLYEKIKNTTDEVAKNALLAELGEILSKYGIVTLIKKQMAFFTPSVF